MAIQESGTIRGEIDLSTAPAFKDALLCAIERSATAIVAVDLEGVSFMDSAGYHAIVDAHEYAVRTDRLLVIRNLSASCTKLIRLCDVDNEITLENGAAEPN